MSNLQQDFLGKKVLIFGLGLNQGGVGSANFFARHGATVKVTDLKTSDILKPSLDQLKNFPEIEYVLGEHRFEDIDWADLIIKNPGVKPGNKYIEYAKQKGKIVEMDMGIFLQYVNQKNIIGVTGTKGKSTTTSLIYELLKDTGKKVMLAGNIGISILDSLERIKDDSLILLELSSFQLESFEDKKISPHISVITNIFPDHLNYYSSMEEYTQSKKIIALYQTKDDFLFIPKEDPVISKDKFLKDIQSNIKFFDEQQLPKDFSPKLLGEHNRKNIAAALEVAKLLSIDEKQALEILGNFTGVEFRLQLVQEVKGIKIYNDTTATNPDATIQALKTLSKIREDKNNGLILIAGGMNKNMPYEELAKAIDEYSNEVYLLEGDASEQIQKMINPEKIKGVFDNLEKLLLTIKSYIKPGDVLLFSPGATSFNMFQNEFDRGRKFNAAVEKVFLCSEK